MHRNQGLVLGVPWALGPGSSLIWVPLGLGSSLIWVPLGPGVGGLGWGGGEVRTIFTNFDKIGETREMVK